MSDFLREELQRAFALDDAARASFERDEPRSDAPAVVYKTTHTPRPTQQQSAPAMDAETEARWNEWLTAAIRNAMTANNRMMVDATAAFVSEYVAKKLKAETSRLRADLLLELRGGPANSGNELLAWPPRKVADATRR